MKGYTRALGHKQKYAGRYNILAHGKYSRALTQEERAEWADRLERIMDRKPYGRKFTLEDTEEKA